MCRLVLGLCFGSLLLMSSFSAAEIVRRPIISLTPAGEITWGQNVRFTCSTSPEKYVSAVFMTTSSSTAWKRVAKLSSRGSVVASLTFSQVTFDDDGLYQCRFRDSSGYSQSPLSGFVKLSVKVNLPKPSISADVHSEVVWGNDVVITCSISTRHVDGTFTLMKTSDSSPTQSQETSSSSATFNIRQVNFDDEGSYRCQYQTSSSSQDFYSPKSDPITFSVIVPLQQPEITLSSPDGTLQWSPGAVEVTWGHSFVITCSVPSHYPGGLFTLSFSGSTANDTKPAVNQSASFEFPTTNYDHHGNYSCVYEVTLSSRKFTSAETWISVVIELPLWMLVSSVSAGIVLLLLLLVPLVIFLVRKRRQVVTQHGVPSLTPMSVGNHYEDSDSDEEANYINFDPAQCKNMHKAQTCGMLDEENEFSDDDDDDDDYVNVNQPFAEDATDIYEDQMDIYENV
ncbi:soluble scavenger receptor cysteine-rich domain-containing SSC5D-like isoform X3 [Solea senegalensis]|uniref:Soluble scavenger receptor cysteine-rich domain-containing SSC5D-like isoform X3 n=1 Tax=Solea senegalensis TaxID=28829 RepID=A0AAV6RPF2_SOLSE|nr:alpha-1B-glycoprotein-like [Solea senegalensis]KAG7505937.1 soluble scavenger receptor cysteine-rich domain-containing SSC5D-like isoform X3 [Solea senegalensis]